MHSYSDQRGNKHSITDAELEIAVNTKIELQKSANGTCNWSKLCNLLKQQGIDAKKCENFRVLVRNYQKGMGKLPSAKKYAEMLSDNRLSAVKNEIGELNIAKRELQNLKRQFGKLKRYVTDTEIDKKELYNLASKNVNVKVTKYDYVDNVNYDNDNLVVVLSDLHIGALTNLPNSKYNSKIAFGYLLDYANRITTMIKEKKPRNVYIVNLGDMIEGSFMRYNQSFDIDLNQSEQQAKAIDYVTTFVSAIYEHANHYGAKLYYTGIAGNHDRSNGNKKNNIDGDSFITVLNSIIHSMSNKLEDFEYLEPDTPTRTKIYVNGHWLKFVHGDLDNLNKSSVLSDLSQVDGLHYDAVIGGHKHSLMIKENNGLVIQSGSIVGNTQYSSNLGLNASRSQVIINVNNQGITPVPVLLNRKRQ